MITNVEFAQKLKDVAANHKTLYVMGCFGAPMTASNKTRYCNNHSYNKKPARTKMIQAATADTFGFDCSGLIKAILWGWNGDKKKTYGGSVYTSNGMPDIGADKMISKCKDVSTDFSKIEVGEAVWMSGHIGVYVGNGLVVESTPAWKNGVQITACNRNVSGYNSRDWVKHGKLPYVEYVKVEEKPAATPSATIAQKVSDTKMPQIRLNSKGKAVKIWQVIVGVTADGVFGKNTRLATIEFQKKAFPNDSKEWDGIVGDKTWKAGLESVTK